MKEFLCHEKKINPSVIDGSTSITDLIDNCFLAYNAGRIREICRLYDLKFCRNDVVIGVSLAGALTPAGLGISCIVPLMQHGLIDWIVSTGANLYHDLHFSLDKNLYRGSPFYDDRELRNAGLVRIYDIVFDYDVLLSTDAFVRRICSSKEFAKKMGTAEFHYLLGKYAAERENQLGITQNSILSAAFKYDIPIYTPSPGDSSTGMNIAALDLAGQGPEIDTSRDVNESAALVYYTKKNNRKSAVFILGGGSPKNFLLQTEPHIQEILGLEDAGHDYFIQVTDARPDTGGLSGATPSEAVSWGKIDPLALPDTVVAYADTTIVLPIVSAYLFSKQRKRDHSRLYNKRALFYNELKTDLRQKC